MIADAALAQQQTEPAAEPLSTTPEKCWHSGYDYSFFKVCISRHGNVVMLKSPSGKQHIAAGQITEGYIACIRLSANGSVLSYFDAGLAESGWAKPYKVTTNPSRIYRKTNDGKLLLVQQFTGDAAEFDFTIAMTLVNLTSKKLYDVRLDRYVNLDIDNSWDGDEFHRSRRAVFGWENYQMVTLTNLSLWSATTAIHANAGGWGIDTCGAASAPSPTGPGDWIGRLSFNFGTIAAGSSKVVKLLYRVE